MREVWKKEIKIMNRVCEALGIEKPVIQAPMTWITSAELVAAVSNAGGLGTKKALRPSQPSAPSMQHRLQSGRRWASK